MKRFAGKLKRSKGFTMVEIIVVVVIIAVLAGLILPRFIGRIGTAKRSVAQGNITEIEKAIEMFSYDYGRPPESLDELVNKPADISEEKWNPPTLKPKNLIDPWGREFIYRQPGEHGRYDVCSFGADGQVGGEKENEDINNW